jgi:hypothetical protein
MIYVREQRALRIVASCKGGYVALDFYDRMDVAKMEGGTNFPLRKHDFEQAMAILEKEGLVASTLERLDGVLYALTESGRRMMENEGFNFDEEAVAKTRRVFGVHAPV